MPDSVYQEQRALLDRIHYFESNARHFDEDPRAGMVDATNSHIAYAKARLDHINTMITRFETSPHA